MYKESRQPNISMNNYPTEKKCIKRYELTTYKRGSSLESKHGNMLKLIIREMQIKTVECHFMALMMITKV